MSTETGNGQTFDVTTCKARDGGWCETDKGLRLELVLGPDPTGNCCLRDEDGVLYGRRLEQLRNLPSEGEREPGRRVAVRLTHDQERDIGKGDEVLARVCAVGNNEFDYLIRHDETRYELPLTPDGEGEGVKSLINQLTEAMGISGEVDVVEHARHLKDANRQIAERARQARDHLGWREGESLVRAAQRVADTITRIRTALGCSEGEGTVEAVERAKESLDKVNNAMLKTAENAAIVSRHNVELRRENKRLREGRAEPLRVNGEPVRVFMTPYRKRKLSEKGNVSIGAYIIPQTIEEHSDTETYHLIPADAGAGDPYDRDKPLTDEDRKRAGLPPADDPTPRDSEPQDQDEQALTVAYMAGAADRRDGEHKRTAFAREVHGCSRCGADHEHVEFHRFARRPDEHVTHWGRCPTTGDPILMEVNTHSQYKPDAEAQQRQDERGGESIREQRINSEAPPLTQEEAEEAYNNAEPVEISEEEIKRLASYAKQYAEPPDWKQRAKQLGRIARKLNAEKHRLLRLLNDDNMTHAETLDRILSERGGDRYGEGWHIELDQPYNTITTSGGRVWVPSGPPTPKEDDEQSEIDAETRLMGAAPAMYQALRDYVQAAKMVDQKHMGSDPADPDGELLNQMWLALAEAKGDNSFIMETASHATFSTPTRCGECERLAAELERAGNGADHGTKLECREIADSLRKSGDISEAAKLIVHLYGVCRDRESDRDCLAGEVEQLKDYIVRISKGHTAAMDSKYRSDQRAEQAEQALDNARQERDRARNKMASAEKSAVHTRRERDAARREAEQAKMAERTWYNNYLKHGDTVMELRGKLKESQREAEGLREGLRNLSKAVRAFQAADPPSVDHERRRSEMIGECSRGESILNTTPPTSPGLKSEEELWERFGLWLVPMLTIVNGDWKIHIYVREWAGAGNPHPTVAKRETWAEALAAARERAQKGWDER